MHKMETACGRQTGYFRTGWKLIGKLLACNLFLDGRPDTSERDGNFLPNCASASFALGRQTGYFRTGWKLTGFNDFFPGLIWTADRILQNGMET